MKKKILFHSNSSKALTGFGKNCRNILSYLYKTKKYEIIELSNGIQENDPKLNLMPWKCIGALPSDSQTILRIKNDSKFRSKALYGGLRIEEVIESEKPDIYIGSEDIWAFSGWWNNRWWKKINTILWTTIDSIPILSAATEAYENSDLFFTWSKFASKEMKKEGCNEVEYLHGPVDCKTFHKLSANKKKKIRADNNIPEDCFVIGFVFRNQLRKSVANLLDGFKKFKKESGCNSKLLLHTNWQEGWDIPKLLKEKGIDNKEILTTYYCKNCKRYEIKPFASEDKSSGEQLTCPFCFSTKSQNTIKVDQGVSDFQLNEIYSIMDVYCHPFTSGGQEIPIQEAKLSGLITLVTNYSCGEDCAHKDSGGLPLSWNEYREQGTQFIKASTCPNSICKNLLKVYNMNDKEKEAYSNKAIRFTKENYSLESTCNKLMSFLDKMPVINWDYKINKLLPDINQKIPEDCSDTDFILKCYKDLLKMEINKKSSVFKFLKNKLQSGTSREDIFKALKNNAEKELESIEKKPKEISYYLDDSDLGKRIALILPKSIGDVFIATSLFPEIKKNYPDYNLYFVTSPEYFPILDGNPYIHKVLPYTHEYSDSLFLEGFSNRTDRKDHAGFFDIAILLNTHTQRIPNYTRNGIDKLGIDICI